ncbi:MAG: FAD-dependent monooxygenase [Acidimicrobiia bacterium]
MTTRDRRNGNAIVIGASMAGLMAARVLSDHFEHVTIIERDLLTDDIDTRRGVPQGRHVHGLLTAGREKLEHWFPGIVAEMEHDGAVRVEVDDSWWWQAGAFAVRGGVNLNALTASRPLFENATRRRVGRTPGVTIRDGLKIDGLIVDSAGVHGVIARNEELRADLVVDCSGRNSRFVVEAGKAGFPTPEMSNVDVGIVYGTVLLERRPNDIDGSFAIVAATPPAENRGAILLPIEGERWILTLAGMHGDAPPTDEDGFRGFAKSLPTPIIADLLEKTTILTSVATYNLKSNQRRHFEKLRRTPPGYLALGDAICSFNPVYAQGMSSAALQVDALDSILNKHSVASRQFARAFYRAASKVVNNPWQIAVGSDFLHPATTGPKPAGTDLVNKYMARVLKAAHVSPVVRRQFMQVAALVDPPPSLMKPGMMLRVFRESKRSPAADKLGSDSRVDAPTSPVA